MLEKRSRFWAFMLQVNNIRSFHMLSLPRISIFFFLVRLTKKGVKSKSSSSKWIRSQAAISILQPDFPFFFQWILGKRDKSCEFIRKWLTNFDKSPQVCNKSYNDLETVLKKKKKKKKKRNSQYQRNRNKITIYYFKFF